MSKRVVYLSDEQWKKIEPLIPKPPPRPKGGRPRADDRLVFEGILWILKTGARWKDLPDKYPHPSTCWRRLKEWYEAEVLKDMWRAFLSELDANGVLDWEEAFIDASFFPAKKGRGSRKNQKGKGHKVHGGGRWQGCSSGKPYRLCFASRGQARRKDTPANQSPQSGAGEAQDTSQESDRRQGIRQRPAS